MNEKTEIETEKNQRKKTRKRSLKFFAIENFERKNEKKNICSIFK
jgi:hypothetical protein